MLMQYTEAGGGFAGVSLLPSLSSLGLGVAVRHGGRYW